MDKKFSQLIQFTKSWNRKENDLSKTFAGDLFKGSGWFFGLSPFEEIEFEKKDVSIKLSQNLVESVAYDKIEKAQGPHIDNHQLESSSEYKYKVLFLGDTHEGQEDDDLLGKMIKAMKLESSEFLRFKFNDELEKVDDLVANLQNPSEASKKLFDFIVDNPAKVLVTLGATTTNVISGKRQKLSNIHGQFFPVKIDNYALKSSTQLVPIFHPDYLKINPNMKKTAWVDLQEVMKVIGKI